jgi:hypothetical protein
VGGLAAGAKVDASIAFGEGTTAGSQPNIYFGTYGPKAARSWEVGSVILLYDNATGGPAAPVFNVFFWATSGYDDTDINTDACIGFLHFADGEQAAIGNVRYWTDHPVELSIFDKDNPNTTSGYPRLHCSIQNAHSADALHANAKIVLMVGLKQVVG